MAFLAVQLMGTENIRQAGWNAGCSNHWTNCGGLQALYLQLPRLSTNSACRRCRMRFRAAMGQTLSFPRDIGYSS
jgi:hypothetical protein